MRFLLQFGYYTFSIFSSLLWNDVLWAAESKSVPTLGDIANKLIVGTDIITRLVLAGCVTAGVMLIVASFVYFKAHRQNPKFVPLDRPIFYLFFGIILVAVPFFGKIFGPTGSVLELPKKTPMVQENRSRYPNDIDAPLELGNEYDH